MSTTITNVTELQAMADNLAGSYILGNDIDASATSTWNDGAGFDPIGDGGTPFTGTFDGAGYAITGLFIYRPTEDDVGLWGSVASPATITDCSVTGSVTGEIDTGGLVGYLASGTVENSSFSGDVVGTDYYTGGLIGVAQDGAIGKHSYSTGTVTGDAGVGGLIGACVGATMVLSESYSEADVTGTGSVGGLVGLLAEATISNCYAKGDVDGDTFVGGLVGNATALGDGYVNHSYSTGAVTGNTSVGGLVGSSTAGTVTTSYWDTQTSGQATSSGGTGKTTAQMITRNTYSGWNFNTIWGIDSITNNGYPYLAFTAEGTRCYTIPIVLDDHGRIAKGARVRAYRDDTGELVKEGIIDSNGNATICGLPNDVDISFHVTWGGGA